MYDAWGNGVPRLSPKETALGIWQRFSLPELRYGDIPGAMLLAQARMMLPKDEDLRELHGLLENQQLSSAVSSNDPFWGNPPPRGTLPAFVPGRVPLALLNTGDVLSLPLGDLCKNMLLLGPTGSGKTNFLRLLLLAVMQDARSLIAAFCRKGGELIDAATLAAPTLPLLVLHAHELQLALLQPPARVNVASFTAVLVQLLAQALNLFASRRLMADTLESLYQRPRAPGTWPRLSEWLEAIDHTRASSASRAGEYREAALYAMKGIWRELGPALDYAQSTFADELFAESGAVVICTDGLSVESEALLALVLMNHAYVSRQSANVRSLPCLFFALDDALPLIRGTIAGESEGGVNPVATWSFMGRSRRMGIIAAAQNFALLSPALRNNASTLLCFGSYGKDAEELARFLNLTRDQAAVLPRMQPGEVVAIARSVFPLALHGSLPEVR